MICMFLSLGNVYIADSSNHRIRMVTILTGIISTIAGSSTNGYSGDGGQATSATLKNPDGVALDSSGIIIIIIIIIIIMILFVFMMMP